MMARIAFLAAVGGFMWAARSFMPDEQLDPSRPGLTLALGFVLLAAYFAGKLVSSFGLPKLTGYLLAGMVSGPAALDLVTESMVGRLQLVNGVAVALIALTAGGELDLRRMRPLLRSIAWITAIAIVGTMLLLAGTLLLMSPWLSFLETMAVPARVSAALVLAVTLAAQSPAVVIAVRSETAAEGPLIRTILGVVVVADLVVLVLFAITSAVCRAVLQGEVDAVHTVGTVAWELFGSMGAGLLVGGVLLVYLKKVQSSASLFLVAICVAVAEVGTRVHLDPLITALTAGVLVENASDKGHALLRDIAEASLPLYLVFFAVAGASIHLDVLLVVGGPAVLLVAVRAMGFLGGSRIAVKIAGGPPEIGKQVGFGLLPQAGLAIALALLLARTFPELGPDAAALTLGVVAINEMLAPVFFRRALIRSGEGRADALPADAVVEH